MSLTKRDIARTIHRAAPDISISEAVSLVDAIFQAIKDRLAGGEKVMITNFGTFQVVDRAPRQGINPSTGTSLVIDGHRAVAFRPAPSLQGSLNGGEEGPRAVAESGDEHDDSGARPRDGHEDGVAGSRGEPKRGGAGSEERLESTDLDPDMGR